MRILLVVAVIIGGTLLVSCANPLDSGSAYWSAYMDGDGALADGFSAAITTDSSQPAYHSTTSGTTYFYFNNYKSRGYTVNGSSTATSSGPNFRQGTYNFSGGRLVKLQWDAIGETSGYKYIYFDDGTEWIYNYSTKEYKK